MLSTASATTTTSSVEKDPTVSIASSNAYATQPPCVQACIMGASNGIDVGCGNALLNSCFCRAGPQSSALYQVSSCVSANCNGTTTDINNVRSLYTAYCSTAMLSTASAAATSSDAKNNPTISIASPNACCSTTTPSTTPPTTSVTTTMANTMATNSGTEDNPTVSITSSNAYATQPPCVQGCIMGASNGIDVGCGNPLLDSCFCHADLQSSAVYQVSSCVSVSCSGATTDINNAISLYTVYCSSDTLTATSSPGEVQPSVTSSGSSAAQRTGKSCSWLLQLMHSWHGTWALGKPLETIQKLTLATFSELCWRWGQWHIKG